MIYLCLHPGFFSQFLMVTSPQKVTCWILMILLPPRKEEDAASHISILHMLGVIIGRTMWPSWMNPCKFEDLFRIWNFGTSKCLTVWEGDQPYRYPFFLSVCFDHPEKMQKKLAFVHQEYHKLKVYPRNTELCQTFWENPIIKTVLKKKHWKNFQSNLFPSLVRGGRNRHLDFNISLKLKTPPHFVPEQWQKNWVVYCIPGIKKLASYVGSLITIMRIPINQPVEWKVGGFLSRLACQWVFCSILEAFGVYRRSWRRRLRPLNFVVINDWAVFEVSYALGCIIGSRWLFGNFSINSILMIANWWIKQKSVCKFVNYDTTDETWFAGMFRFRTYLGCLPYQHKIWSINSRLVIFLLRGFMNFDFHTFRLILLEWVAQLPPSCYSFLKSQQQPWTHGNPGSGRDFNSAMFNSCCLFISDWTGHLLPWVH